MSLRVSLDSFFYENRILSGFNIFKRILYKEICIFSLKKVNYKKIIQRFPFQKIVLLWGDFY